MQIKCSSNANNYNYNQYRFLSKMWFVLGPIFFNANSLILVVEKNNIYPNVTKHHIVDKGFIILKCEYRGGEHKYDFI